MENKAGSGVYGSNDGTNQNTSGDMGSATSIKRDVQSAAKDAKEEVAREVKDHAANFVQRNKSIVTTQLNSVADALRASGDRLQNESLRDYCVRAAERLDDLGRTIEQRSLREMAEDLRGLARRQPALFVGASFAAGFVAARFLKSSPSLTSSSPDSYQPFRAVSESRFESDEYSLGESYRPGGGAVY